MQKLKYILGLAFIGLFLIGQFSCSNEENSSVNTMEGLEINADFLKLVDNGTDVAGELYIASNAKDIQLIWNADSICNLDTTLTTISSESGKCVLPIKWQKQLSDSIFAPKGVAYKAGVKIVAGEYSKYVPLIWAEKIDTAKVMESIKPVTRGGSDALPRVAQITMVPTTVNMNSNSGGSMYVGLSEVPFVIFDFSEFTSDKNIDMSKLPNHITESQFLDFKWKSGGAPSFEFSANVIAMSEGLTQIGVIQYRKTASQISLSANPLSLNLSSNQGARISSTITTNDIQGWTAVISEGNWFTITTSGINGDLLEVVSTTANTTGAPRIGKITVSSKSSPSVQTTITVTQATFTNITISANPTLLKLQSAAGSSAYSVITTNDPLGWTATSSADWLTVTGTGNSGGVMTVVASTASNSTKRSATVTVRSQTDPSKIVTIVVEQGVNSSNRTVKWLTVYGAFGSYTNPNAVLGDIGWLCYNFYNPAVNISDFGSYGKCPFASLSVNQINYGSINASNLSSVFSQYDIIYITGEKTLWDANTENAFINYVRQSNKKSVILYECHDANNNKNMLNILPRLGYGFGGRVGSANGLQWSMEPGGLPNDIFGRVTGVASTFSSYGYTYYFNSYPSGASPVRSNTSLVIDVWDPSTWMFVTGDDDHFDTEAMLGMNVNATTARNLNTTTYSNVSNLRFLANLMEFIINNVPRK